MLPKRISFDIFKIMHLDAEGIMHSKHMKIRMLTCVALACSFYLFFLLFALNDPVLLLPLFIALAILSLASLTLGILPVILLLLFSLISSEIALYIIGTLSGFLFGSWGNLILLLLLNLLLVFILEVKLHW